MGEFSTLQGGNQNIPFAGPDTNPESLGLMNPDSVLTGTSRGTQFVGSNTLQIDSTQALVTIKGPNTTSPSILRVGQIASNFLGLAVGNGTLDTMFAGQDNTGNTVVKVAKTGFDVKTATNDQLIFNSSQNTFKVVLTGSTTIAVPDPFTTAGSPLIATIPHGLSITPAFQVFATIPAGAGVIGSGVLTNLPAMVGGSGAITAFAQAATDSTNLYIYVRNNNGTNLTGSPFGATWTFRYYILQETAN